jgi:hypothetical protein
MSAQLASSVELKLKSEAHSAHRPAQQDFARACAAATAARSVRGLVGCAAQFAARRNFQAISRSGASAYSAPWSRKGVAARPIRSAHRASPCVSGRQFPRPPCPVFRALDTSSACTLCPVTSMRSSRKLESQCPSAVTCRPRTTPMFHVYPRSSGLTPLAGNFAFAPFALGIVGTGLLAVPSGAVDWIRGWHSGQMRFWGRWKAPHEVGNGHFWVGHFEYPRIRGCGIARLRGSEHHSEAGCGEARSSPDPMTRARIGAGNIDHGRPQNSASI